ncbi:hypothetical protein HF086_017496, partial [Spodoptera exigua]
MRESLRRLASDDGMERRGRIAGTRRVRVELMLAEHITIDVDRKARGSDLLDKICDSLDLVERDYFGLLYTQRGDPRVWVDLNRRLSKTFKNEPWDVRFAVKFYPPEPSELKDDATRGQSPAEAELNYLETAKRLAQYGAELHAALDCNAVPIALAVCHAGVAVYRD